MFEVLEPQVGDQVKVMFYEDELPYVSEMHPELLEPGEVVETKQELYWVAFGERVEVFEKRKLVRV
ncbi:MAG: hypothetical protein ABS949_10895 [Solibacillus sp.]